MNISLNKEDFSIDNVYFNEPIRNSIIENSSFIRVIYSNELMAINGIYIKIDFDNVTKTNDFSKQKINININDNLKIINYIKSIEIEILEKINIERKENDRECWGRVENYAYEVQDSIPRRSERWKNLSNIAIHSRYIR
jgi:hypothetical protein